MLTRPEDDAGGARMVDDDVDSLGDERIGYGKRRTPIMLTCKHRSPSARSIPSWKELKAERWVGECVLKVRDPKQINSSGINES
jgi:hypothetical protein